MATKEQDKDAHDNAGRQESEDRAERGRTMALRSVSHIGKAEEDDISVIWVIRPYAGVWRSRREKAACFL
jgi:hypothetical protein